MLEIVAQGDGKYIIKITEGYYFYGNGELGRSLFGWHPDLFLRFDPYMYDPVEGMVIPDKILDFIEKYADICAEGVEWDGQCDPRNPEAYKEHWAYREAQGEFHDPEGAVFEAEDDEESDDD